MAVPLAAGVAYPTVSLHPAAAAAAMAGSCLVVLLNAQRLSLSQPTTCEQMLRELTLQETESNTNAKGTDETKSTSSTSERSPQSISSFPLYDGSLTHASALEDHFSLDGQGGPSDSCCQAAEEDEGPTWALAGPLRGRSCSSLPNGFSTAGVGDEFGG